MIWLTLLAAAIIFGAAFAESKRQFGSALFDMGAILLSVNLAKLAAPGLAGAVTLLGAPDNNRALALALLFVAFAGALLMLAKFLQDLALLTLDSLDPIVGAVFGFVCGLAAANIVLVILLTGNPADTQWGAAARKTLAVRQLVDWEGYRETMQFLRHAGE